MAETLDVATRKGLFMFRRGKRGEAWREHKRAFVGDNVTNTLRDARDGTLYAGLNLGHFGCKLRRSTDDGESWTDLTPPTYPPQPDAAPGATPDVPWKLELLWALAAGGADQPGRLWCGTIPGGLFVSDDRGDSWSLNRPLWETPRRREWFGGGYDHPGIHSILVDPRDSRRVTVGVSCGGVWRTTDDGRTWACCADGMFAEYMPPERREDPAIQDPHIIAFCRARPEVMWAQHHNGVFRTESGGDRWSHVPKARPSGFGFAVAAHPSDGKTAWFAPAVKDECRVPVDGRVVVSRTRDGGETFEVLGKGLPERDAYDLVYRHALDVDGEGRSLAMGSTTGSLWTSDDAGDSWRAVSEHLPPIHAVHLGGR